MAPTKVRLKLFIDKKSKRRVLYAESDKEFVDFLFSIFTLPVGAVTRPLKERGGMVGSLPSLYRSIENMSDTYIQPDKGKRFVLQPKLVVPGAKVPLLLPNVGSTFCELYRCSNKSQSDNCSGYVSIDSSTLCPSCRHKMDGYVTLVNPSSALGFYFFDGYVKGTVKYMVMDDLEVRPLSSTTLVTLLSQFNVNDVRDIEEKVVDVGMGEVCQSSFVLRALQPLIASFF
jgi:hypothetical protein